MPRSARLIVGLALTAIALWLANPVAVLRAAATADWRWILAAVLLVIPDRALMAYRWLVLLRAPGTARHVPLREILRIFFVSTFLGTFLPSAGGDAVRAVALSRYAVPGSDAAASVVMDRLLGAWALLLFAIPGVLLVRVIRDDAGILLALAMTGAVAAAAGAVIYSEWVAAAGRRLIAALPLAGLRRVSEGLLDAIRRYRAHDAVVTNVLIGSILVQALRIVQAYCLGRSLGIEAGLAAYFALIPWTLLVMLVPISVNGLGTSQIAFVYLFGLIGVASAQSFALSVLCIALGAVGNLPGGLIYASAAPAGLRAKTTD